MKELAEKIDIILPSRIGDCILSFPAFLCLKQLIEKHQNKKLKVRIISTNKLTEVIDAFNFFEVKQDTNFVKFQTLLNKPDKTFFLHSSMNNLGFFAKETYGLTIPSKRIKYTVEMPYLYVEKTESHLPEKLFKFLREKHNFAYKTICNFGMLLEMGFSSEDIIETFDFNQDSLNFEKEITNWKPEIDNYIAFCMEAAYGRKRDADRRFSEESYFEIANKIHQEFGFKSAFIGINNKVKIPINSYFIDYRKKLSFSQLAILLKNSKGYIGNDTGPLHLANLMKKPSLSVYAPTRESSLVTYNPIFSNLNTPVLNFPEWDQVNSFCSKLS